MRKYSFVARTWCFFSCPSFVSSSRKNVLVVAARGKHWCNSLVERRRGGGSKKKARDERTRYYRSRTIRSGQLAVRHNSKTEKEKKYANLQLCSRKEQKIEQKKNNRKQETLKVSSISRENIYIHSWLMKFPLILWNLWSSHKLLSILYFP